MKAEFARLCAALLGLVVFAAAQDLAPTMFGAKPPILLAFGCFAGIPTALIAGLFADSLGAMPFGCSAIFFLAAATAVRLARSAAVGIIAAGAGLYQVWIAIWGGGTAFSVNGVLATLAAALVIAPVMRAALQLARRRIGINEEAAKR